MSGTDETTQRDPLDLLAEEFLRRHRKGPIDVEAFAAEHPAHADSLRELLPTLLALEGCKRERESSGSNRGRVSIPALTQLGDFRIVGELGRGGMGVVFDAVQESLGRRVALKVLPQASLLTGNQLERFRREAQIAAQLHHSNIVPVFGSGESEGYHWYAMQFIAGESLDRWRQLQAEARPNGTGAWRNRARFCARIGIQAASALHYAHSQGTLHRDIKPANLLLDASEHLWVTDFGLAKALEAEGLTHSGDLLGTLQYMAPEQFEGTYDVRSEVYALGITLYETMVLKPAFAGKTRSELMEKIRTERPESLRRICPDAPEDLVVVIEKAMAREPRDRYSDAHALEQDLQAFLEDRPIQARRQSAPALVLRWCRRNRAMAALAASTFVAFLGAGITGWVAYGITDDALGRADDALGRAKASAAVAQEQFELNKKNLKTTLDAFSDVFDALIGRDPALALEEDEETGEQTVTVTTVVAPRDVALLKQMLEFYGQFAAQNAGNEALQLETARANRRVGAICARLGKPEDLETAATAYAKAIAGLQGLTGRDVRREVAQAKVELGQLEQRRKGPQKAEQLFTEALETLESLPASKNVRLERAKVELLLAGAMLPRRPGGGRSGGPGGRSQGGSSNPRTAPPFNGDRARRAREHVQQVVALVDGLLQEEPGNVECRVMKARTQLLSARLTGRRPEGGRPDGERRARPSDAERQAAEQERQAAEQERQRLQQSALGILREVVDAYPDNDAWRSELVGALLESLSRGDGGGGPGSRERSHNAADVALLREARSHADRLLVQQPMIVDYRAQAGFVGRQLANALRDVADAERKATSAEADKVMLAEAESVLIDTLAIEQELIAGSTAEPRFLLQAFETRIALGRLYQQTNRRDDALAQVPAALDLLDRLAAQLPSPMLDRLLGLADGQRPPDRGGDRGPGDRGPGDRGPGGRQQPDGLSPNRGDGRADGRQWRWLDEVIRHGTPELQQRWSAFRTLLKLRAGR